jgi:hypothetical protein
MSRVTASPRHLAGVSTRANRTLRAVTRCAAEPCQLGRDFNCLLRGGLDSTMASLQLCRHRRGFAFCNLKRGGIEIEREALYLSYQFSVTQISIQTIASIQFGKHPIPMLGLSQTVYWVSTQSLYWDYYREKWLFAVIFAENVYRRSA